jgi:hypothetical protein
MAPMNCAVHSEETYYDKNFHVSVLNVSISKASTAATLKAHTDVNQANISHIIYWTEMLQGKAKPLSSRIKCPRMSS